MHLARLFLLVAMTVSGINAAGAQMTDPFEALATWKREEIALEKRMKRNAAEQREREKTQKDAQRQQDLATAKSDKAARPSPATAKPSQPAVGQPAQSLAAPKS